MKLLAYSPFVPFDHWGVFLLLGGMIVFVIVSRLPSPLFVVSPIVNWNLLNWNLLKRNPMRVRSAALAVLSLLVPYFLAAQTVTTFEGIDASQLSAPGVDVDPNGAAGTKQYMEWVNTSYQAYDKSTFAAVWPSPQNGDSPWRDNNMQNCYGAGGGDGIITFDRLASRWVIARRASNQGTYYYCVAISNTDDLKSTSLAWFTYQFALNSVISTNSFGHTYWPDWPRFGTWADGYYFSFNLQDPDNAFQNIGVIACAL